MKTSIFLVLLLFIGNGILAQDSLSIQFKAFSDDEAIVLNQGGYEYEGEPIVFESLKFYVSQFALLKSGEIVWSEENSYHLVDAEDEYSMNIVLSHPDDLEYDQIEFLLGIDSMTNVSGAMGGDLDPTKGMYWAWNSGYINFKLEGTSSLCATSRNNAFTYHLGGYAVPFASVQTIHLATNHTQQMEIGIDIDEFLENIDMKEQHSIMSPGEKAQALSVIASTIFFVKE